MTVVELAKTVAHCPQELQDTAILIEGHTDSTAQADYNQDLSLERALQVKSVLVKHYGIESDRLTIRDWGNHSQWRAIYRSRAERLIGV